MKIINKINKGLVLTIIVLVVLIVYLINVETKRNSEKPNIEQAVKEYIHLVNKYAVMPQEYQKIYGYQYLEDDQLAKEIDKVIIEQSEKFENEFKRISIENAELTKMQKEMIINLISQRSNFVTEVLTKYNKEITNIHSYVFDDDQVTIQFSSETDIETMYQEGNNNQIKARSEKVEDEVVTMQLVDGNWKIVYADLKDYPNEIYKNVMF